jgi:HNH endonuclease
MNRCIYCLNDLIAGAEDGRQPSLEHIVQYAIGGSDGLATREVCNRCNSTLGDTVDSRFIHCHLIGFARLQHGLEGHGGTVPDVSLKATPTTGVRPAEIRFKRNAVVEFRHRPEVSKTAMGKDAERIDIGGLPEDARRIVEGLLAKAKKTGGSLWTSEGQKVTSADQLIERASVETFNTYKGQVVINKHDLYSGLAKIAFGFAHLVMGPSWTFSSESNRLRQVARGLGSVEDAEALMKGGDRKLRGLYRDVSSEDHSHVLGLMVGQPNRILVSLFGGEAMTYAIDAGSQLDLVDADRVGASIDLESRITTWTGLTEMAARIQAGALRKP